MLTALSALNQKNYHDVEILFSQGQILKARELMGSLVPLSSSEMRMQAHLSGKFLFHEGRYSEAIARFEEALLKYGPHLSLLADLIYSYMMAGEYRKANHQLQFAKNEYSKLECELSPMRKVRALLLFAKLNFEWMEFTESLDSLKKIIEIYKSVHLGSDNQNILDPIWLDQAITLLLRNSAFLYLPQKDWENWYGRVSQIHPLAESRLTFLQYNALLIADANLFGVEKSKLRLKAFIQRGFFKEDQALGLSELIELILLEQKSNKMKSHEDIIDIFLKSSPRDNYDRALQIILKSKDVNEETVFLCLEKLETDNPLGQYRLLNILAATTCSESVKEELERRIHLLICSLGAKDAELLNYRINHFKKNKMIVLEYISNQRLKVNFIEIVYKSNSLIEYLVNALRTNQFIPIDKIVHDVWNGEYNESYYKRLWIAVKRFNSSLSKSMAGNKAFRCLKDGVYLNENIKIK